jgi:hypothetical protein
MASEGSVTTVEPACADTVVGVSATSEEELDTGIVPRLNSLAAKILTPLFTDTDPAIDTVPPNAIDMLAPTTL